VTTEQEQAETRTGAAWISRDSWICVDDGGCGSSGAWPPNCREGDASCPECGQGPVSHVLIETLDPTPPVPYRPESLLYSNVSVGGTKRLTWAEEAEREAIRANSHQPLVTFAADLDRCEHGRHRGDPCTFPDGGCGGPSIGNAVLSSLGLTVGHGLGGSPYALHGPDGRITLRGEQIWPRS
jgi:hypothetical protein